MLIFLHVFIAISSMCYTGYVLFFPSRKKLGLVYLLVGGTLASGFYLVITMPAHILSTCIVGLFYLGFTGLGIFATHHKLAQEKEG